MRFLTPRSLYELWKHCLPLAPALARRRGSRLLPCPPRTLIRPVFTGGSLRTDVPPPEQTEPTEEKLDLDIWKSVMRSQVPSEESDEEEVSPPEVGPGAAAASPLEAIRELVMMWREAGKKVPENLTDEELQTVAELATKSARKKFLKFLSIKEGYKKARKEKQQKKKEERALADEDTVTDDEGAGHKTKNSFLPPFMGRLRDRVRNWNAAQAMMFGQPLVFDMSYEPLMSRRELTYTVQQLQDVEAFNRRAVDPFHLHFCNLQPDGGYQRELLRCYGAKQWESLFVTCTPQRHVDVFPPERLVYLTADSPNVLRTFDRSKVYIVGSLVDRSILPGVSLANAKRLNLATARLPLDEFLHWGSGAKTLTLDQMIRILLTVKETGSWEEALEFVPKRKHGGLHPEPEKRPGWQREGSSAGAWKTGYKEGRERGFDHRARKEGFTAGDIGRGFRDGDGGRSFRDRDTGRSFRDGDTGRSFRDGDSGRSFRDGDRGRSFRDWDRDRRPPNANRHVELTDNLRDRIKQPLHWTGDENKTPPKRRLALKSKMEERNSLGKNRKDWNDE